MSSKLCLLKQSDFLKCKIIQCIANSLLILQIINHGISVVTWLKQWVYQYVYNGPIATIKPKK